MPNLYRRIKRRLRLGYKHFKQDYINPNNLNKTIVFILGCQRSGTTMLTEVFEADKDIRAYSEFSRLSSQNNPRLRLNPLPKVKVQLKRNHPKTIVLKPLVESQNAVSMLNFFENSKAIWVYRHFKDVAASNLKKFGQRNGIDDLRPIAAREAGNWRSQNVSEETFKIIDKYYSEDMSTRDAAALFWYSRNILFFEQGLDTNDNVYLCSYRDLVSNPQDKLRQIYDFMGAEFPVNGVNGVHARSLGKGTEFQLSPDVESICTGLWKRLNEVHEGQQIRRHSAAGVSA